jgi:hypothetical protein
LANGDKGTSIENSASSTYGSSENLGTKKETGAPYENRNAETARTDIQAGSNAKKEERTFFNFVNLESYSKLDYLRRESMPQAQVLDLAILSNKKNRQPYYQPWRKSFYLLGGVHSISAIATQEELKVSPNDLTIDALQYEIGMGAYFEKGNFRLGLGLHHNSLSRDARFVSESVKDTVLIDVSSTTEISSIDSTLLGYVPNQIWDPVKQQWVNDGVRPNWKVDTTYSTTNDTVFTNAKDTSYSNQTGQLRQQYLEVPISLAYVWSKGRFKLAVQGGYSLGYLVSERINYSSENNSALQQEYTSNKSLLHFLVFNPEVSYAVGSRASIFAQPTYRHRLSGGSMQAIEPGQLGLRFGLMYDF